MSYSEVVLVSLNARGLRDSLKRKAIFLLCKESKSDFIFLQESHSCTADVSFWKAQWGNDIWFSHGSNRSGGVAILRCGNKGNVLHFKADLNGHWLILVFEYDDHQLILCNFYGNSASRDNEKLIVDIEKHIVHFLDLYPKSSIITGGDFNIVMDNLMDRFPSRPRSKCNCLQSFCLNLDLLDIWRVKNPDIKLFTWNNKDLSLQSRIDMWLISKELESKVNSIEIIPSILSDHKLIKIHLVLEDKPCNIKYGSYWKLNNLLLNNDDLVRDINILIDKYWNVANNTKEFGKNWELLKFEIRCLSINKGKELAIKKRVRIKNIIHRLSVIYNNPGKNVIDLKELECLQTELDNIYKEKARGAFIRSRQKWMEEGEKNCRYFFGLEKRKIQNSLLKKLRIEDTICTDITGVSDFVTNFYKNLYKAVHHPDSSQLFNSLRNPIIANEEFKANCSDEITLEEIKDSICRLKNNKSPGNDGLTSEFFKLFVDKISPFLLAVYEESFLRGELPPSLKQGIITLIPKPNKDLLVIDNWRPITLLNNDYKVIASVLASRLKSGLKSLISVNQSGFIKDRHISNNIRLIMDLIDYRDILTGDPFILFLDFYKAFDTISHTFIFDTLLFFNLGYPFVNMVKTLYNDINSSVRLAFGMSPRFFVKRGIRQGCPISPLLFLLCSQILCMLIEQHSFKGINIGSLELKISQLADDTSLFLESKMEISKSLDAIQLFSKFSGLNLNLQKCELLPLNKCDVNSILNIPVKDVVTYLGIKITKNAKSIKDLNYTPIINNVQKRFNIWLARDLSIHGRVLLSKSEGLSRAAYVFSALEAPKSAMGQLDKNLFNFIWRNKSHKVKKTVLKNNVADGGLNVLDFTTLNQTIKINWLKRFIKNPENIWNAIPNLIFKKVGGLKFLLMCPYNVNKLPIQLSAFHRQALLYWLLIYKHNFSPHELLLWNNKYIVYKGKSLFMDIWFNKNILFIHQLLNDNKNFISYSEFCNKFGTIGSNTDFKRVCDSIPNGILCLLKGNYIFSDIFSLNNYTISLCGVDIVNKKCNNNFIRKLLSPKSIPSVTFKWAAQQRINARLIWTLPYKYVLNNKIKDMLYKILHRCYPVNATVSKFCDISDACVFCKGATESIEHLFFHCVFSCSFWIDLFLDLKRRLGKEIPLKSQYILYIFDDPLFDHKEKFIVNLIIMLGKYYIHKMKFVKKLPSSQSFIHSDLNNYIHTLANFRQTKNKKWHKAVDMLKLFNFI